MTRKKLIMFGMVVGSYIGGYVPSLWNSGMFSMSGIIGTALGGFLGIYIAFKLSDGME